jgi:hypothetical protein
MSYTVGFKVTNGQVHEVTVSGGLPDGEYLIGGHEDQLGNSINVTRKLPTGMHVVEAQHYQSYHNYDPDKFQVPVEPVRRPYVEDVSLPDAPVVSPARRKTAEQPVTPQDPSEAELYNPVASVKALMDDDDDEHDGPDNAWR